MSTTKRIMTSTAARPNSYYHPPLSSPSQENLHPLQRRAASPRRAATSLTNGRAITRLRDQLPVARSTARAEGRLRGSAGAASLARAHVRAIHSRRAPPSVYFNEARAGPVLPRPAAAICHVAGAGAPRDERFTRDARGALFLPPRQRHRINKWPAI